MKPFFLFCLIGLLPTALRAQRAAVDSLPHLSGTPAIAVATFRTAAPALSTQRGYTVAEPGRRVSVTGRPAATARKSAQEAGAGRARKTHPAGRRRGWTWLGVAALFEGLDGYR